MSVREFLKETSILAVLMTAPPIALLVFFKLMEPKMSWSTIVLWAILTISWMTLMALLYYRKSLKRISK